MVDGYMMRGRIEQGKKAKADGAFFEKIIEDACFRYGLRGDAYIEKTPEPLKPLKRLTSGKFTAVYEAKAQPDFKGTLKGGRAVCFEAKSTNGNKIDCNRLQPQQLEALQKHEKLGAVVFILVMFLKENRCYKISLTRWLGAKQTLGRNYFRPDDLKDCAIPTEGMKIDFLTDELEGVKNYDKQNNL